MAKIKVVKKGIDLPDNISSDYTTMLEATGAMIFRKKQTSTQCFTTLSKYSVKPKRERGQSKKKKRKK